MEHDSAVSLNSKLDTQNNTSPGETLTDRRLYVEFRVYFDARTNQELLHEMADVAKDRLYDLFDGTEDDSSGPLPSPHDVTYELVLEVRGKRLPPIPNPHNIPGLESADDDRGEN